MVDKHVELQDANDSSARNLIMIKLNSKVQRNTFEFYFYCIAVNLDFVWKPRCALLRVRSVVITAPTSFPMTEWLSKYNHKGQAFFSWNFILKWASRGSLGKNKAIESGFQGTHMYLLYGKPILFLTVMCYFCSASAMWILAGNLLCRIFSPR